MANKVLQSKQICGMHKVRNFNFCTECIAQIYSSVFFQCLYRSHAQICSCACFPVVCVPFACPDILSCLFGLALAYFPVTWPTVDYSGRIVGPGMHRKRLPKLILGFHWVVCGNGNYLTARGNDFDHQGERLDHQGERLASLGKEVVLVA